MAPITVIEKICRAHSNLFSSYDLDRGVVNIFPKSGGPKLHDTISLSTDSVLPKNFLVDKDILGLKKRGILVDTGSFPTRFRKKRFSLDQRSQSIRTILNSVVKESTLPLRWEMLSLPGRTDGISWVLRFAEFDTMLARKEYLNMEIDTIGLGGNNPEYVARAIHEISGLKFGIATLKGCQEPAKEKGFPVPRPSQSGRRSNVEGRASIRSFMDAYVSANSCYSWAQDPVNSIVNILPRRGSALNWEFQGYHGKSSFWELLETRDVFGLKGRNIYIHFGKIISRRLNEPRDIEIAAGPIETAFNQVLAGLDGAFIWKMDSVSGNRHFLIFQ